MENQREEITITAEDYRALLEDSLSLGIIVSYIQKHIDWDDIYNRYNLQNPDLLLEMIESLGYSTISHAMQKARVEGTRGEENGF